MDRGAGTGNAPADEVGGDKERGRAAFGAGTGPLGEPLDGGSETGRRVRVVLGLAAGENRRLDRTTVKEKHFLFHLYKTSQ